MRLKFARRWMLAAVAGLVAGMQVAPGLAQDYPVKPVIFVVPFPAGGPVDTGARIVAEKLEPLLGQPVVIENKPGAAGAIATTYVMNSDADGYTLLFTSPSVMNDALIANLTFNVLEDLQPVSPIWEYHSIVWVNDKVPAKSLKDLVAYAKENPGELSYGQNTTSGMLEMEMLKAKERLDIVGIPYQGSAPAAAGMLSGEIQIVLDSLGRWKGQMEEGVVTPVAVTGGIRWPELPDVPTMSEIGYPDLTMTVMGGLWGPKGLPDNVVAKLNGAINEVLQEPEMHKRFLDQAWLTVPGAPDKLRNQVAKEIDFWTKAAKTADYSPK